MYDVLRRIYRFLRKHPAKTRLALVAVLFAVLFSNIHPRDILITIGRADPWYLTIAVILLVPNIAMQLVKWHYILRVINPRPPFRLTLISLFGGFFLAVSTPGRTGELARGFLMPGYSKVRIASLTVVDKGFSQLMVILFGLLGTSLLLPFPFSLLPILIIITLLIALFNAHRLRPYIERILKRFAHSEMIDNALAAFDALSFDMVFGMLLFSVVFYLTFTIQLFIILRAFTEVPVGVGVQGVPLIYFANTLMPISIGEFGMKDFAAVQILGRFDIPGAAVLSATFTQTVMTLIIPSIIGGIMFAFTKHPPIREARSLDDRTIPRSGASHPRDDG